MSSNITLAKEIWYDLVDFISPVDRDNAAEAFVSILIEHDVSPADIKAAFDKDEYISEVVAEHVPHNQEHIDSLDDEEEWEYDEDEGHEDY